MSDINTEIPRFLRDLLRKQYGEDAERIERGYACRRPVTLRANALKAGGDEVDRELSRLGIAHLRMPWYEDAFLLTDAREREIRATPLYESGAVYLQSLSSMLPPLLLQPEAGETVLDMTAAPGGKTAQMYAMSGGKALITACEKDRIRFDRLKFNLARQGAVRVNAMQTDALRLDEFFRFDKILLDAPCSGSGTISEGGASRCTEALVAACVRAQEALLRKALRLLKKGGTLVYSTCSVLKQENEELVERCLSGSGCSLVPVGEDFAPEIPRLAGGAGCVTVCPSERFEGFFLAKIAK